MHTFVRFVSQCGALWFLCFRSDRMDFFKRNMKNSTNDFQLQLELRTNQESIQALSQRVLILTTQLEEQRAKYERDVISKKQHSFHTFNEENNDNEKKNQQLHADIEELQQKIKERDAKFSALEQRYAQMYGEYVHTQKMLQEQIKNYALEAEKEMARARAESEKRRLQNEVRRMKARLDPNEAARTGNGKVDAHAHAHEDENADGNLKNGDNEEINIKLLEQEQMILEQTVNDQKQALIERDEQLRRAMEQIKELEVVRSKNAEHEIEIENMRKTLIREAAEELARQKKLASDVLENTQQRYQTLEEELSTLRGTSQQEIEILHQMLEKQSADFQAVKNEFSTFRDSKQQELDETLKVLDNERAEFASTRQILQQQISELHSEAAILTKQLSEQQTAYLTLAQLQRDTSRLNGELQVQLDSLNEQKQTEIISMKALIERKQAEYDADSARLQQQVMDRDTIIASLSSELRDRISANQALQDQNTAEIADLRQQLVFSNNELEKKRAALQVYHVEIENAKRLKQKQDETERMKRSNSLLAPLRMLAAKIKKDGNLDTSINEQVDMLAGCNNMELAEEVAVALSERLQKLRTEVSDRTSAYEALQNQHASEVARLTQQLAFTNSELEKTRAKLHALDTKVENAKYQKKTIHQDTGSRRA